MKTRVLLLLVLTLLAAAACGRRADPGLGEAPGERIDPGPLDERAIRDLLGRHVAAVESRDLDAVMALYAPDLVAFGAFAPRQYEGTDAYRQAYRSFFEAFPGPVTAEIVDQRIAITGDLAVVYGIERWSAIDAENRVTDFVWRFTDVLRRSGGEWRIVHEHISFPADPATGAADFLSRP